MRLFFRSLIILLFLSLLSIIYPNTVGAATIPYTITLGVPVRSPNPVGETFLTTNLTVNYQSGSIVLSSKPDGTGNTLVDDAIEMVITVTQPNGSSSTFRHSYQTGCYTISESPPIDITRFFGQGENKVTVRLYDVCGVNLFSSSLYLVNLNAPETSGKTPLILIPGIGGSELKTAEMKVWAENDGHGGTFNYLYPKDETVWLNEPKATDLGNDDYFDVLRMKTDGINSEVNLGLTGNLLARAYQEAIDFFTSNDGYTLNQDLFIFPYDWRKDISLTVPLLDQKINEIKLQTGTAKVDIVAHSMGGLVARIYISNASRAGNVRKLFTLGSPYLGSVNSLKSLRYGDCLTIRELKDFPICIGLNPLEVKDVVQNMISSFELVPSQAYYSFYSGHDNNHPYPYKTESGALNYTQIKSFLTNLSYNTALFNPSELFHVLDSSLTNTNGVDVTVIAGSGQPTLGQIIEEKRLSLLGIPYVHKDIVDINGDGTVPLLSASLNDPSQSLSLLGNAKVFYTKQDHGNLVSSGPALNLVKNTLNNDSQLPDGVSAAPYHFGGTGLSVHSPVNIHVYDSLGNHTGPKDNGDFEANIPGSSYDTLDDAKFIFLPDNGRYEIRFEATDQGSFDFKIREFENDINTTAVLYNDIPLAAATKAEAILDTSLIQPPTLQVDQDGNGITDRNIDPTFVLTGDAVYDDTPPEAKIFIDQDKQDLTVIGVDANPTTVTRLENTTTKKKNDAFYLIIDAAGNSLKLDVREIDRNRKDRFRIYSMQYNGDDPIVLDNNHFNVTYQGKKDKLNIKEQNYELKGEVKIRIQYDIKKNKSTIILKEPKGEKLKAVIEGLIILELNTDNGQLRTYFEQSST